MNRDIHRKTSSPTQSQFQRRRKSVDIGDIWAEQRHLNDVETREIAKLMHEKQTRRATLSRKEVAKTETKILLAKAGQYMYERFSTSPDASQKKPAPRRRLVQRPKISTTPEKVVEIKISVPPLPDTAKFKSQFAKIPRKYILITVGAIASLVVGMLVAPLIGRVIAPDSDPTPSLTLQKGTPTFPTIIPSGKTAEDLGGWTRVSPPDRNPVFAYTDKIGVVSINVSQQPLPKDFSGDTDTHVQRLANSFNASQKVMVGSLPVYIGTSGKGPQSVIFQRDGLLVLIKSTDKISTDQWIAYVNSLK